jgi:hypothetical protein
VESIISRSATSITLRTRPDPSQSTHVRWPAISPLAASEPIAACS